MGHLEVGLYGVVYEGLAAVEARHEVVDSEVVDGRLQTRLLGIHQNPHSMISCTLDTTHTHSPATVMVHSTTGGRLTSPMSSNLSTSLANCSSSDSVSGVNPSPHP